MRGTDADEMWLPSHGVFQGICNLPSMATSYAYCSRIPSRKGFRYTCKLNMVRQ